MQDLLEVPLRDRPTAIAGKYDLALLRDLEDRRRGGCRARQDRAVHRSTPSTDRAASAVEDDQLHASGSRGTRKVLLSTVGCPRRGEVAAVLVAVRVAHHHLLAIA